MVSLKRNTLMTYNRGRPVFLPVCGGTLSPPSYGVKKLADNDAC
jgi:hypothetical protein